MITVRDLTRKFGNVLAVDHVSFEVEKGEVVGFLGPNGAGKTTTMRMITGFLPATSGAVSVAGYDVLRESMEVRKKIGYLPEAVPLYREHRVEEMLRFQARLHGLDRSKAKERIGTVLEQVDLTARARQPIGKLSKGLRQRVGIAVALLPAPEVLILDEPTSGLDPLQRLEVRALLTQLASEHTVLLSSHILPEVEAVCPRVIVIAQGRVAADGQKDDLVSELGGSTHVRVEAVVPGGAGEAMRLLRTIDGVRDVMDRGRVGIHHQFDVLCDVDLREDVGALAAMKGWALRELSWQKPTLEQLFARIALGMADETHPAGEVEAPAPAEAPVANVAAPKLESSLPIAAPAPPTQAEAPTKIVYNLNPFDQGASRDLGAPKAIEEDEGS